MKAVMYFLAICTMSVCTISCSDDDPVQMADGINSDEQLIEINYINQAWGNWFTSHFILSNGNHFYFQDNSDTTNPIPEDWNLTDDDGLISINKLSDNILKADSLVQLIDVGLLEDLEDLSFSLKEDNSDPEYLCDDAGVVTVYVYVWDSDKEKFKRKLVKQCGDWAMNNNHKDARKILDLMSTLPIATNFGCCIE